LLSLFFLETLHQPRQLLQISNAASGDVREEEATEDEFRLGGQPPLARNKESRRVRRFSRHRTASGDAAAAEYLEAGAPRIQSPVAVRRSRIHQLSGGRPASPTESSEVSQERQHSDLLASRRTASRSASRHRHRLRSGNLSPVRGETVAAVDSVEQLVVRHRVAGIQRSFTQVLKDSSEKRAAAEAATASSSRRPLRDQAEQSIVNRILKEVGVRATSPSSALPEAGAAEEGRRGESRQLLKEPDKQKSWYQKAASKIGLKTSSGDTAAAIVVTEKATVNSTEAPMRESKSIPNAASKEGENSGNKFESPELKKKTEREGFVCRERTESVCSDNLPDLSLVQEDRLEADKPYLDEEVSTNAEEAEQSRQGSFPASPLLLVKELDKSGLFLTSFDHDDEEEEDEEDLDLMSRISEAAADPIVCQEELPCGSPAPHLEAMRPMLKEQVSLLLEAVLRPPETSRQTGILHREHVEESLVEKITDVINRTLSDQAAAVKDFDTVTCPAVPKSTTAEKDKETDMSMALESRDMSMALARVENNKADCDCCGDGDLSEQDNVYDVFDLREDKKMMILKVRKNITDYGLL
jgi:hypothetical protein